MISCAPRRPPQAEDDPDPGAAVDRRSGTVTRSSTGYRAGSGAADDAERRDRGARRRRRRSSPTSRRCASSPTGSWATRTTERRVPVRTSTGPARSSCSSRRCTVRSATMTELPGSRPVGVSPASPSSASAAIVDCPTVDELEGALFAPEQPAVVRGDPAGRRRRHGRRRQRRVTCGFSSSIPKLGAEGTATRSCARPTPTRARRRTHARSRSAPTRRSSCGRACPSTETALLCLFERHHYARAETNFDMTIDLAAIPDDPGGHVLATAGGSRRGRGLDGDTLAELAGRGDARRSTRATSCSPAATMASARSARSRSTEPGSSARSRCGPT